MRIFVLAVIGALCAASAMAGPFVNGDFEDPYVAVKTAIVPTGWTTYVNSGAFVWQLEPGGTQLPGSNQWFQMYTTATSSCVGGLYQTFDTVAGAPYTIGGYAAAVHLDMNARIGIVQGAFGGTVNWLVTASGDTEWHSFSTPVTATGSSMTILCEGYNNAPTSKVSRVVKFDNIEVIPEPGSVIAVLTGLIGLSGFAVRRRR